MSNEFIDCRMGSAKIQCNINMSGIPVRLNFFHNARITFYNSTNFNGRVDLPNCIDGGAMFEWCASLNAPVTIPDSFTYLSSAFLGCTNFNQPINIPANVNSTQVMFAGCVNFNSPVTFADGVVGVYADRMFINCYNFNSPVDFGNRLRDGKEMFGGCHNFNHPIHIDYPQDVNFNNYNAYFNSMVASSKFDSDVSILNFPQGTSYITLERMAYNCPNLSERNFTVSTRGPVNTIVFLDLFAHDINMNSNIDILGITANQVYCADMFYNCQKFNRPVVFPQNVSSFNYAFFQCWKLNQPIDMSTPKANTTCHNMFAACVRFNQHITIPYGINNCVNMFYACYNFNQPITIPDSVVNCMDMFSHCNNFNSSVHIGSNVNVCSTMFRNCNNFNQPITIPDSVVSASLMFEYCNNFNSPVHIGNIKHCNGMFDGCTNFNQSVTIPSSATTCVRMFAYCTNLDSPITILDGEQKNCANMFAGCNNFNSPVVIGRGVTSCNSMFTDCYNFSQDVYIPDGATFTAIFHWIRNYKATISVPTLSRPGDTGITPSASTLGATVIARSSGQMYTVIPNVYNNGVPTGGYIWSGEPGGSQYSGDIYYDSPTTISEGTTSTAAYFSGCTSYDQDTSIPSSVVTCYKMFSKCSSFNSQITFESSEEGV